MAPNPEQRQAFGARLAELRAAARTSQQAIVQSLPHYGGNLVTGSAYSEWERGISAPSAENVAALEKVFLEPAGSLAGLLGLRGDDPAMEARLSALEEWAKRTEQALERLLRAAGLEP